MFESIGSLKYPMVQFSNRSTSTSLVASKHVDIGVFEHNSWRCTSLLIELCYLFPSVKVNRVSFASIQHSIYGSPTDGINEILLMS